MTSSELITFAKSSFPNKVTFRVLGSHGFWGDHPWARARGFTEALGVSEVATGSTSFLGDPEGSGWDPSVTAAASGRVIPSWEPVHCLRESLVALRP